MTEPCENPGENLVSSNPETTDPTADGSAPLIPQADEAVQEVNNSCECKQTDDTSDNGESVDVVSLTVPLEGEKKRLKRNVSFPSDTCVKSYLEPPDPSAHRKAKKWTTVDLIQAYKHGCEKHGTKPLTKVLQQLQGIENTGERYEILSLKGEKLDTKICESLEEIFKLVQFRCVDLEATHLDDETAVALFDMIEYYESACKVNISFNKSISGRGWQACSRLIRKTPGLTFLDMRNCDCNERVIPLLGRSLRMGCFLTTLHMENTNISGRALVVLVAALKMNELLKELFLADNKLMPTDGIQLGNLLKYNHTLQLLDLRNNNLQDVGVGHICDGLYEQNLDTGLCTLVLWNNQITYQAMAAIGKAISQTENLETLNLGHNNLTNEGIHLVKDGLLASKSLLRLGLQATKISCEGAVALAEAIADSHRLLRVDLRENDIKTAGLMALSLALKGMKDYAEQQRRLQDELSRCLERNRDLAKAKAKEAESQAKMSESKTKPEPVTEEKEEMVPTEASLLESLDTVRRPGLLFIRDPPMIPLEQTLDSPHVCPVPTSQFAGIMGLSTSLPSRDVVSSLDSPTLGIPSIPIATPPAEVILSPQYVPQVKKKKVFTVSKVDIQSLISPTAMSVLPATSKIILSPTISNMTFSGCASPELPKSQFVSNDSKFMLLLADPDKADGLMDYDNERESMESEEVSEKEELQADSSQSGVIQENAQEVIGDSPGISMCNKGDSQVHSETVPKTEESSSPLESENSESQVSDISCDKVNQSGKSANTVKTENINIVEFSVVSNDGMQNKNKIAVQDSKINNTENEQWTHVKHPVPDSDVLSDQNKLETGNPDFHSTFTMNGMTQELASALDNIDTEKYQNKELSYGKKWTSISCKKN
ncbi:hypothetical protein FSP39_014146 [Pinctada imbricata]|uniref:Protein phosphatase 1 regulatory subunit 37 n=1 Tax=Pinctada imbricata TaxID=66713 RepID=A0AA89BT26_PINIB|nr:hypothetical protein FSP39_014146 [Pinctada imbricata]